MTDAPRAPVNRPLTLVEPQIGQLLAGKLTALRRPPTLLYRGCQPGDRFWIREPFHLASKWSGLSPTAAAKFGATPVFAADLGPGWQRGDLGPRQFGRTMLRAWHRQHLVVTAVDRERLQALGPAEIAAEGFKGMAEFALAWNRNLALAAGDFAWERDPQVLVLRFTRVAEPLPPRESAT